MSSPTVIIEGLVFRHHAGATGDGGFEVRLDAFRLAPGELVALVGPSGCGKSTLLDLIGLILAPQALTRYTLRPPGETPLDLADTLRAAEIDRLAPIRRRRLGYVLQQGGLLPFLTVRENIAIAGGSNDGAYARSLAERLGVSALLERYPAQISIGQRQRVGIARALHSAPALILADEPTAALDPPTADETLDLFVETARERGAAVIMANHDWGAVERRGFARLAPQIGRGPHGAVVTFERAAA